MLEENGFSSYSFCQGNNLKIICGNSLEVLKTMPSNSLHSLVTDPPAGISFMGKDWDGDLGGMENWVVEMSKIFCECLRVLKPGSHGLVWALPRTSHWTALALHRAGFEIRDVITHVFGSGFPKSLNISKAIDKHFGAEREKIAPLPYTDQDIRNNNFDRQDGKNDRIQNYITSPATPEAKHYDGFGTALKPASEHWVLIRKPISEKSIAENVLLHGTGGINIDGCRVGKETITQHKRDFTNIHGNKFGPCVKQPVLGITSTTQGRFPANFILSHHDDCNTECHSDCPVKLLDEQSGNLGVSKGGNSTNIGKNISFQTDYSESYKKGKPCGFGDSGGASRFFYCAKASPKERGENNNHPCVKSLKLMSYLIKLVTPPNGIVLDPFLGSGSTLLAADSLGLGCIGIDKNPDYIEIALNRSQKEWGKT